MEANMDFSGAIIEIKEGPSILKLLGNKKKMTLEMVMTMATIMEMEMETETKTPCRCLY